MLVNLFFTVFPTFFDLHQVYLIENFLNSSHLLFSADDTDSGSAVEELADDLACGSFDAVYNFTDVKRFALDFIDADNIHKKLLPDQCGHLPRVKFRHNDTIKLLNQRF